MVYEEVLGAIETYGWKRGFVFEQCPYVKIKDIVVKKQRRSKRLPDGAVTVTLTLEYLTNNHNAIWEQTAQYTTGKVYVFEDIQLVESELATKGAEVFGKRFNKQKYDKYMCDKHHWKILK